MSDKPSPPLVKDDRVVGTHVCVGTNVWFNHWLADSNIESFRYECPEGSFTARRRKGDYWNAYRKVKGKLRQEYLGKSPDLTQTKLIETARTLAMDNTEYWRMKYPRPEQPSQPLQESTVLYNQAADCITETNSKETTNAVRQWCVFARHNDGKLQFMGGYWSKGDATARMHKSQRDHHLSESIGDKAYIGSPPTYEVKEMLVAPVGLYNQSADCITEAQETEIAKLQNKLIVQTNLVGQYQRDLKKAQEAIAQLTEEVGLYKSKCITDSKGDDLKEEVRRLQAVVNLEKQQKEMCQHKLDKAQQSNKELMNLAREARAELERLQSSTNSADPGAILNRLRKEYKNSKASLKDVELIIELLQAIAF